MFIVGIVAAFLLIFLLDLKKLINANQRKTTLLAYLLLLTTGFSISLLQILADKPPSPAVYIEKMIDFLLGGGTP
ncbi:MAG: hypothetical protein KGZ33_06000 [Alkaliphilus sp.]|nr:hypothetical protein [Alkaliphilus sp.]